MALPTIKIVETEDKLLIKLLQDLVQSHLSCKERGQGFITKVEHIFNHPIYRYRIYYKYPTAYPHEYEHLIQHQGVW